jgi:hypothetical protein
VFIDTPAIGATFVALPPQPQLVTVKGHYTGSAPAVYAFVAAGTGAFASGLTAVNLTPDNTFNVQLFLNDRADPGTYKGMLDVAVCGDPNCSTRYPVSPSSIPYTITIVPRIPLTVEINGMPAPFAGPGYTSDLVEGDVLTLTAAQPVRWDVSSVLRDAVVVTAQTDTVWTATVRYPGFHAYQTVRALHVDLDLEVAAQTFVVNH